MIDRHVSFGYFKPVLDNRPIEFSTLRVGSAISLRPGLSLVGDLGIAKFRGHSIQPDDSRIAVDTTSIEASAQLRQALFIAQHWSAHMEWGWGITLTNDDFPPKGTRINATPQFGVRTIWDVSPSFTLTAGLHNFHLSNGKGIVSNNPAYDAWGFSVGLVHEKGLPMKNQPIAPWHFSGDDQNSSNRFNGILQFQRGEVGEGEEGGFSGIAMSAVYTFLPGWAVQLDTSNDWIEGNQFSDIGLRLRSRNHSYSHSVYARNREFAEFSTQEIGIHSEWYSNDVASIGLTYGYEDRNIQEPRQKAGIFIRLYPMASLMFRSGVSLMEEPEGSTKPKDADIDFGIEYQSLQMRRYGLSVFLENNTETRFLGLRYSFGRPVSLRQRDRTKIQQLYRF